MDLDDLYGDGLIGQKEAARAVNKSVRTVQRWRESGFFPPADSTDRGRPYWKVRNIRAFAILFPWLKTTALAPKDEPEPTQKRK